MGLFAGFARNRRVLDCFTNQGAFALTCARAGASDVTGVEENSENIAAAKRNAAQNDLKERWIEQDVFQFLRAAEKSGTQYDLIVLDPPSFTKPGADYATRCVVIGNCTCARSSFSRKKVYWRPFHARIT